MSKTFESVVEQARACSTEEKEELKFLLERAIIEERRKEIHANRRNSQDEVKRGSLKFSSSINQLKKFWLTDDASCLQYVVQAGFQKTD